MKSIILELQVSSDEGVKGSALLALEEELAQREAIYNKKKEELEASALLDEKDKIDILEDYERLIHDLGLAKDQLQEAKHVINSVTDVKLQESELEDMIRGLQARLEEIRRIKEGVVDEEELKLSEELQISIGRLMKLKKFCSEQTPKSSVSVQNSIECLRSTIARRNQSVDVLFLVDLTMSIEKYKEEIKSAIKLVSDEMRSKYSEGSFRVGFVGYKDLPEKTHPDFEEMNYLYKRTMVLKFTRSVATIEDLLAGLVCSGGFDVPEDVNVGLRVAVNDFEWVSKNRLLFHIADAPCHGQEFHDERDNYPNGIDGDLPYGELFKIMIEKGIQYVFLQVNKLTNKMLRRFQDIWADQIKGESGEQSRAELNILPISGHDSITKIVREGVFRSIEKSSRFDTCIL